VPSYDQRKKCVHFTAAVHINTKLWGEPPKVGDILSFIKPVLLQCYTYIPVLS